MPINALTSRKSSNFLGRIVGLMFMGRTRGAPTRCAHQQSSLWGTLVRRAFETFREVLGRSQVRVDHVRRVVSALEFFQHHLSEMGHRRLLVTHTLPDRSIGLTRSV